MACRILQLELEKVSRGNSQSLAGGDRPGFAPLAARSELFMTLITFTQPLILRFIICHLKS